MITMLIHLPGAGALTRALCMTLVHSVWQGLLASVLAGFFIATTRRSRAAMRYNLLTLVVLLFLLQVGATFYRELGVGHILPAAFTTGATHRVTVVRALADLTAVHTPATGLHPAVLLVKGGHFLTRHATAVVLIWMLCLLVQLLRMAGGLYQVSKLRSSKVFLPSGEWKDRLAALAAQFGITREVALLQSALVKMPSTFGFLKPSILVPLGMLTNLPADQVETILLHELAHIRRNDYLMNLGLHLLEAVFFFNPGVRWIAIRLREEREACCDDMVVRGVRDSNNYLEALVAFREYADGRGRGYALSLGKTDLLWRIRRMLNHENRKLQFMEKAILSIGLSVLLVIGLISMRNGEKHLHKANRESTSMTASFASYIVQPAADTVPGTGTIQKAKFPTINTSIDDNGTTRKTKVNAKDAEGNTFELTKVNDEVTSLIINGKEIPKGSYSQYMYIFDEIGRRSAHPHEPQEWTERSQDDQVAEQQAKLERMQEMLVHQQEEVQAKVERDQQEAEARVERQQQQQEEAQARARAAYEENQQKLERMQEDVAARAEVLARAQQEAGEEATQMNADRFARNIIHDLMDKGIVGEKQEISFKLDNQALIVNGARQPEEVFKYFKEKYVKSPKDHFIYHRRAKGATSDVWVE
jgi:beta-lactamase regulating signal transducer with metallopeptidase domain